MPKIGSQNRVPKQGPFSGPRYLARSQFEILLSSFTEILRFGFQIISYPNCISNDVFEMPKIGSQNRVPKQGPFSGPGYLSSSGFETSTHICKLFMMFKFIVFPRIDLNMELPKKVFQTGS